MLQIGARVSVSRYDGEMQDILASLEGFATPWGPIYTGHFRADLAIAS